MRTCERSRLSESDLSASVLHFVPSVDLGAKPNLQAFIDLCSKSEVLAAHLQFDANIWDIGHLKGRNGVHRAVFSTVEAASNCAYEPLLPQPFRDFGKAMLIYLQDCRPVVNQTTRLSALRCLEAGLREWNRPCPTAVNFEVLDTAVELAKKYFGAAFAYQVAGQLKLISELMHKKGFISLRQRWDHGINRPQALGSRISKEALTARKEKMPSAAALRALAGIFQEAVEPRDILVSSCTALMACAPERINEVLRLKRNCVVIGEGRYVGHIGLRWPGSKGASDTVKWFPSEMVSVAEQAVARLLHVTAPGRELAAWYTENPTKLYLHEAAAHLRNRDVLTTSEIGLILWGNDNARDIANLWAHKTNALEKVFLERHRVGYRFRDVEAAVLSMLPSTFPHMPGAPELLCKDAMAVARVNEMHASRSACLCMFTCVDYTTISQALARRGGQPSIFDRFDYSEDDGSAIEMNSHSLRHYLNMLAQMGGMSSAEIAIFSGRKDASQNRAYDHMSSDEVQEPVKRALQAGMTGGLVAKEPKQLIHRSEFALAKPAAAHSTEYGWCMHDFASEPCQMYRDCINCEEQECTKGDEYKERNLRSLKAETELLLKVAKGAYSEQEYGADTWVAHQIKTLERVDAILQILQDPKVGPGARVRLDVTNAALIIEDSVRSVQFMKSINGNC